MRPLGAIEEGEALARLLLSRRQLGAGALEAARKFAHDRGGRLASALLAVDAIDLDTLAATLGEIHGLETAGADDFVRIDRETLRSLPSRVAVRHLAIPLRRSAAVLEVALVENSDEAVAAITEAAGMRIRAHIAPEPLVFHALRAYYGLTRIPQAIQGLVEAIESGAIRRHAGAIPESPEEYVTTPMAGAIPRSPDEVPTLGVGRADAALSPEEIALGGGDDDDAFGRALIGVTAAISFDAAITAILAWSESEIPASALLARTGGEFRLVRGAGALAEAHDIPVGEGTRSILRAALAGEDGFSGEVPDVPANALLLESIGRDPANVVLFPILREAGAERLLYADFGAGALERDALERLRALAQRLLARAFS